MRLWRDHKREERSRGNDHDARTSHLLGCTLSTFWPEMMKERTFFSVSLQNEILSLSHPLLSPFPSLPLPSRLHASPKSKTGDGM